MVGILVINTAIEQWMIVTSVEGGIGMTLKSEGGCDMDDTNNFPRIE